MKPSVFACRHNPPVATLRIARRMTGLSGVITGGPADTDGRLKPDDRIVSVGQGDTGEMTDIRRLTQDEAIALIRGEDATSVRLGVQKPGEDRIQIITLRRGKVLSPESKIEVRVVGVGAAKVGYIDVPNFYKDEKAGTSTASDVRRHLDKFRSQSIDVVVLDLRRCSGGYLDQALELAGLFLGKGAIIQVKNQSGDVQTDGNQASSMAWQKPLLVLTGRRTASGGEIVCAAIQDYKRGVIVGEDTTYGLGLLRQPYDVGTNMGFLLVTTSQFFRVTGEGFQQRGVTPDVVVPSVDFAYLSGAKEPSSNLGFDRLKAINIQSQDMVSSELVLSLRAHSRERRRNTAEFQTLQTLVEWEQGKSARTVVSLNESEYRATLKDAPTNKLPKAKSGENDFYLQEVVAIAADYAKSLGTKVASSANVVKAPPPEDQAARARRERANERESARQSVQQLEGEIPVLNDRIVVAQLALVAAKAMYDDADPGSGQEFIAQLAYITAQRTLAELQGQLDRAQSELQAARTRYNRLRE